MTLRLLGLMAPCILLVKYTRWHMQAQQWELKSQLAQHKGDLSNEVQISEETAKSLRCGYSTVLGPVADPSPFPTQS